MAKQSLTESPAKQATVGIEVAYAKPNDQKIVVLTVPAGTTVLQAVTLSGITDCYPEINAMPLTLGIYGKAVLKPHERIVCSGDRIEIYRPLLADPKAIRKKRESGHHVSSEQSLPA